MLDHHGLMAFHHGNAAAGATIGFRVVQTAAERIAKLGVELDRKSTRVVSGHPGPGYRDAFEYAFHIEPQFLYTPPSFGNGLSRLTVSYISDTRSAASSKLDSAAL